MTVAVPLIDHDVIDGLLEVLRCVLHVVVQLITEPEDVRPRQDRISPIRIFLDLIHLIRQFADGIEDLTILAVLIVMSFDQEFQEGKEASASYEC